MSLFVRMTIASSVACATIATGCGRGSSTPTQAPSSPSANASIGAPSTAAPNIPRSSIHRPTFVTSEGEIDAGTAFAVRLSPGAQPIVVTALHLLGEAGGHPRDIPAAEAPKVLRRVVLLECFPPFTERTATGPVIAIPDAAPLGVESNAGDVLAVRMPDARGIAALPIATDPPAEGAPIWLVAEVTFAEDDAPFMHRAIVIGQDPDGNLVYRYDAKEIDLVATSGAPVVNAAGEVVAINLGGGTERGETFGVGNPMTRVRPLLGR